MTGASRIKLLFYHNERQKQLAEQSKRELEESGKFSKPIVTPIIAAKPFYKAEAEHQDYYKKQSFHYRLYKKGSGRENFIKEHWRQKPDESELKKKLTPIQYNVTQENGTERPYANEYWDNEKEGIYVDLISGDVCFLHMINLMQAAAGQALPSLWTHTGWKKNRHESWDDPN